MRAAVHQHPPGKKPSLAAAWTSKRLACVETTKIDGSKNEGGSELGPSPRGVLAEGSHVQQGLLDVVAKGRRPALWAVATGDREEQRALLDGVRDADTCMDGSDQISGCVDVDDRIVKF